MIAREGLSRIVLDEPIQTWPQEEHDLARDYLSMALAEAGHPVEWEWHAGQRKYLSTLMDSDLAIPLDVMERARVLVLRRLGRGFTYKEAEATA